MSGKTEKEMLQLIDSLIETLSQITETQRLQHETQQTLWKLYQRLLAALPDDITDDITADIDKDTHT